MIAAPRIKELIKPLLFIACVALLTACRTPRQDSDPSTPQVRNNPSVSNLFAQYHEERLKLYPMEATMAGDHRYDDQLPNSLTESFRASEVAFYRKYLAALGQIDRSRLSAFRTNEVVAGRDEIVSILDSSSPYAPRRIQTSIVVDEILLRMTV